MPTHYTDVEKLILQRWPDVRALMTAYGELEESMEKVIEAVADPLQKWAEEKGYESEVTARKGECYLWKHDWANRRNESGVCLAVGGFIPTGFRKSREAHPYLWVYADLSALRLRASLHDDFLTDLRAAVGDQLAAWQHAEVTDEGPLGRVLTEYDDTHRIQWMSSPTNLLEFLKGAVEQLFELSGPIDRVVRKYRA